MKVKITKQTTRTIEITPVQKSKCSTGERTPKQSILIKAIQIITQKK